MLNRQTSVTSPSVNASGGVLATMAYDADGEVTGTTDANGRPVTYSYDLLGRQTGRELADQLRRCPGVDHVHL